MNYPEPIQFGDLSGDLILESLPFEEGEGILPSQNGIMPRPMSPTSPKHSIFRVRDQLHEVNKKVYEPEVLAIGPYHHGKDKFKFMEEQKLRYLRKLLNGESIDRYMLALRGLKPPPRNCYMEINSSQEGDDFLLMMLIDGCFIVELFRKRIGGRLTDQYDPIMHESGIRTSIRRDLLLLENQLPLFVLSKLYDLTKGPDEDDDFSDVAVRYFNIELGEIAGEAEHESLGEGEKRGEHLLHLYHTWRTSGLPKKPWRYCKTLMPSATELRESGISFRAAPRGKLSDIKFKNGTLELPALNVQDYTESQFRNLMAYEQQRPSRRINYFTDYVTFMDCLINSSKDVKVLRRAGIIKNSLGGDDEVVAQMFNKIGDYATISYSYYSDIFPEVNVHFSKRRNFWMAKLRREYFHSPWALLSVLAAIVLLLLTVAQTVFSILSYKKQS